METGNHSSKSKLVDVCKSLGNPKKNQKGHHYKYADLVAVLKMLKENDVAFYQKPITKLTESGLYLVGVFTWMEGESSEAFMPLTNPDPQKIGSVITYLRRYSLLTMAGMYNEGEDDDGAIFNQSQNNLNNKAQSTNSSLPRNFDDFTFRGGKYKGLTLADIGEEELRSYAAWCAVQQNSKTKEMGQYILAYLEQ